MVCSTADHLAPASKIDTNYTAGLTVDDKVDLQVTCDEAKLTVRVVILRLMTPFTFNLTICVAKCSYTWFRVSGLFLQITTFVWEVAYASFRACFVCVCNSYKWAPCSSKIHMSKGNFAKLQTENSVWLPSTLPVPRAPCSFTSKGLLNDFCQFWSVVWATGSTEGSWTSFVCI